MFILSLPLRVRVSRRKDFIINLNNYRNQHFLILNRAKVVFKEVIRKQVMALPTFNKVKLIYTLYPATLHKMDVANVCSVMDKFFADALVELDKLYDDNYLYIPKIEFEFGAVDKDNPRVEVQIIELQETLQEQDQMQITLDDDKVFAMLNGGQTVRIEIKAVPNSEAVTTTQNTSSQLKSTPVEEPKAPAVEPTVEVETPAQSEPETEAPEPVVRTTEPARKPSLFGSKPVENSEPVQNISSGDEDRLDPEEEQQEEETEQEEVQSEPEPVAEQPVTPKPKSLFNFKKPDNA